MKISLEWLREYVDFQGSPEELAEIFTNVGFPVEQMGKVGDDWMLDVEITSNRPDCLGHIGLAREVATVTGMAYRMPEVNFNETGKNVREWTSVVNESPDLCRRYTARIVSDLEVGPSPDWMRRRLETIGIRSISNVVDITNYVMMEIAQPLHTFDFDRLEGGRIIVRRACRGEQMEMIDHSKVELSEEMLVIADTQNPVALAGVMGGLASEVSDQTKTVLLESAHFHPLSIRKTSRALSLGSESSFRFERDVDVEMLEWASRRAAALLEQLAGGKVAPGVIDVGPGAHQQKEVSLRLSRCNLLVGIEFNSDQVLEIFRRLGLQPRYDGKDLVTCRIPSWRGDLTREADLIEEVIRIHGFEHVPTEQRIHITVKTEDAQQRVKRQVRAALSGCGFYETIGVSFVEEGHWKLFAAEGMNPVRVKDSARKSNNTLRSSLLPSLLAVRKRNQDAGNERCSLYELAAVHHQNPQGPLPVETLKLGLLTDGTFRELRGVLEAVTGRLSRMARLSCRPAEVKWAAKSAGAELLLDDKHIGWIGKAGGTILEIFDLQQDVCLAELDFLPLINLDSTVGELQPLPRYPVITRDLSLVLPEEITWAQVERAILSQNIPELRQIQFVDIYRGKGIEPGRKSLTLSLEFRHQEHTLRHEEVDTFQEQILQNLQEMFGATLRSVSGKG